MKTSACTGDIPLASFITDTTLSTLVLLNLRLKKDTLSAFSVDGVPRRAFVLEKLSIREGARLSRWQQQRQRCPGAEAEFD